MTAFNYLLLFVALAAGNNSVVAVIRPGIPSSRAGVRRSSILDTILELRGGSDATAQVNSAK
jgi:hypothetical protein